MRDHSANDDGAADKDGSTQVQIAFLGIAAEVPDIQRMADYAVEALAQLDAGTKKRRARPKAAASGPRGTLRPRNGALKRSAREPAP